MSFFARSRSSARRWPERIAFQGILEHVKAGRLRPVVDSGVLLWQAEEAHRVLERRSSARSSSRRTRVARERRCKTRIDRCERAHPAPPGPRRWSRPRSSRSPGPRGPCAFFGCSIPPCPARRRCSPGLAAVAIKVRCCGRSGGPWRASGSRGPRPPDARQPLHGTVVGLFTGSSSACRWRRWRSCTATTQGARSRPRRSRSRELERRARPCAPADLPGASSRDDVALRPGPRPSPGRARPGVTRRSFSPASDARIAGDFRAIDLDVDARASLPGPSRSLRTSAGSRSTDERRGRARLPGSVARSSWR